MLQTLPRWRVTVTFEQVPPRAPISFHLSDYHLPNIMQRVAALDFGPDVVGVEVLREVPHALQGQWLGELTIGHGRLGSSTPRGSSIK